MKIVRILITLIALHFFAGVYSQQIEILYDSSYPRQVGGSFPLGIKYTDKKGKTRLTRGFLGGKQYWLYYYINVLGGTFNKGMVNITDNPATITNHQIIVIAQLASDPRICSQISIPLTYYGLTIADYTPSSDDYINGLHGDILDVYISKFYDPIYKGELLKVKIYSSSRNNELEYYVHPTNGQIRIIANGGDGQNGKDKVNGESADDGGNGGNGGSVTVYILENARDCLDKIEILNFGGSGGKGGRSDNSSGRNGLNGLNGPTPRIQIVKNF
ncbi:MAG TPA: hypothetical protein VK179_17060 [Bacteroidales bacterium]|nr:hypothetical protein [Bacteroidales bacterium]